MPMIVTSVTPSSRSAASTGKSPGSDAAHLPISMMASSIVVAHLNNVYSSLRCGTRARAFVNECGRTPCHAPTRSSDRNCRQPRVDLDHGGLLRIITVRNLWRYLERKSRGHRRFYDGYRRILFGHTGQRLLSRLNRRANRCELHQTARRRRHRKRRKVLLPSSNGEHLRHRLHSETVA
jgi:hypothetical protein